MAKNLSLLSVGESAIVSHLDGTSSYATKLQLLGFTPGAKVEVIRAAPMGDPIQIRVRGCNLSLRRSEASVICLESLND